MYRIFGNKRLNKDLIIAGARNPYDSLLSSTFFPAFNSPDFPDFRDTLIDLLDIVFIRTVPKLHQVGMVAWDPDVTRASPTNTAPKIPNPQLSSTRNTRPTRQPIYSSLSDDTAESIKNALKPNPA
jgi:hypothetical protein